MSAGVIIPAGGVGRRMGSKTAKQYLKIKGVPVIDRTLSVFEEHKGIKEIVLVLPKDDIAKHGSRLKRKFSKITRVIAGGKERTDSVRNGFNSFTEDHSVILVHDAVRPFVRDIDISNLISFINKCDAATLAVPVKDTIKIVDNTRISETLDRTRLWHTLTPQVFKKKVLAEALLFAAKKKITGTDECMLAEQMGKDVRVIEGHYFNIKITTPEDLIFGKAILQSVYY